MTSTKIPSVKLNNGYYMPVIGYGTFNSFKENEVQDATRVALELGYRHIDTAWIYQTEEEIGDAITQKIKDGLLKRSDLFLASKLWNTHHRPESVEEMCRESLKSLQTDYLDLYLIHWPIAVKGGGKINEIHGTRPHDDVDLIDTWKAMEELVIKGLVKTIGVSNFNIQQLKRLLAADLRYKPAVNQVEIHPYYTNSELFDYCKQENIVVTAYSPLGRGGRPTDSGGTGKSLNVLEDRTIQKIAAKYNKTTGQICIRWGLDRGYTLIPKSVTPARIKQNFEIFDFSLTEEEVNTISNLNQGYKCVHLNQYKDHPEYPF